MGILDKLFNGKSTPVTSQAIRDEIARAEAQIATHRKNLDIASANIATMDDAQHRLAEEDMTVIKRSIARLEARVSQLAAELPGIVAAEEIAAKGVADEALRRRRENAHKANTKGAAALLNRFDKAATEIAAVLTALEELDAETIAVNNELRRNPVAAHVPSYTDIHRKHPDREAIERREMRLGWVDGDGNFREATLDKHGQPIPSVPSVDRNGRLVPLRLERRQVVVEQAQFRKGHYEEPLSSVRLPPAFATGAYYWPRKR
jgi:hypothetical protein